MSEGAVAVTALGNRLAIDDVKLATFARDVVRPRGEAEISGVSIDSRTAAPGELFVAIAGPRFDGHAFLAEAAARGVTTALVHQDVAAPPGIDLFRVRDTTVALGQLARHVRQAAGIPVVCITGSTGKTTTKEMTAALLAGRGPVLKTEGNLNNQWGLPLTLLRLSGEHRAAVLELGMSAPGEIRALTAIASPDVAVITNVASVHLEYFESVDAIARAKAEILENLPQGAVAVLNGDDPRLRRIGESFAGEVIWFGRDRSHDVFAERWRGTLHGMHFDLWIGGEPVAVSLPLTGLHFVSNFLAAAAAAHRLGVTPEAIAAAAPSLGPAAHRGQVVHLGQGVTLLDDSYNASPVAVEAAVAALALAPQGRRVAFLGDMLELGPEGPELHRKTGEKVAASLDSIVAVGPLAVHFLEGAEDAGISSSAFVSLPDAAAAVDAVPELVRPGDAVLVKGSRRAQLETVVEALVARFGLQEGRD